MQLSGQQQLDLLDLARRMIRAALAGNRSASDQLDPPADAALQQRTGAFVSLHELHTHQLRGCVGRLDATEPMYLATAQAARSVLDDPRFAGKPVLLHELPRLELEITLTFPMRSTSHPLDFDLRTDGIYLTVADRCGCFLPQVARDTGWAKEQLLDRLCQEKIGLPAATWKLPQARVQKFATLLIGPERFDPDAHRAPEPHVVGGN
jgi:uncharacterized protein